MTTNRTWLGLLGAALMFAACSSSQDPLLTTSGRGGSSNGGAGGNTAGAAGTASGGAGGAAGAPSCAQATCLRPYTCRTQCGGPIISNNCCACEAPAFDDFMGMACGGSGGRGGAAGGAAGTGSGGSGGAGGSGSAGRGGSGGGAAGAAGGGAGGRGGAGGAAGTASGGSGGNADGGTDAFNCATAECARPYLCVDACGGPVISNNCCACQAPAFDDFMGMACGDGGTGAISYVGCRYIGGYDRIVVAKRDTSRNLCVNVVLIDGGTPPPAGLTLPPSFRLDSATVGPASACPTMAKLATEGGPVTGSVVSTGDASSIPSTVDVDIHVTLPGYDEAIITRNLDVARGCL
jgi:hypothetical protein